MIPRSVLEAITPKDIPEVTLAIAHDDDQVTDPLALRVHRWAQEFAFALSMALHENELRGLVKDSIDSAFVVGFGILDWHPDQPAHPPTRPKAKSKAPSQSEFPALHGHRLGVAIYLPFGAATNVEPTGKMKEASLDGAYGKYPVGIYRADFTQQTHPSGGRSAAVMEKGGERILLTAGHVVANLPVGTRVDLSCSDCDGQCHAKVRAKGPGYIDAAALTVGHMKCTRKAVPCKRAQPVAGLPIRNHFGSTSGFVQSTIMQGLSSPATLINPVRPRTFLTSTPGVNGDSGSAVSSDPATNAPNLVGIHLGLTDVEVSPGSIRKRAYAHDADEAINLFKSKLSGGLFQ